LPQLRAAHEFATNTLPNLSKPIACLVRSYRDGDLRRDLRRLPAARKHLLTAAEHLLTAAETSLTAAETSLTGVQNTFCNAEGVG
jgi:hypothetical protein